MIYICLVKNSEATIGGDNPFYIFIQQVKMMPSQGHWFLSKASVNTPTRVIADA